MGQIIEKIYLHWSGTHYDWSVPGHYHTIIFNDGTMKRHTGYDQMLRTHTYARNANSVSICAACMGGVAWRDYPPTEIQIDNMCREVASLALDLGWKPTDITLSRVMTHAEAAANRDFSKWQAWQGTGVSFNTARAYGLPHDNYGPVSWHDGWPGGTAERWDWWQLKPSDRGGVGGDLLREKIRGFMKPTPNPELEKIENYQQGNECRLFFEGKVISTGYILSDNRCYARLLDLTSPFQIRIGRVESENVRFINLLSDKYKPKFLADSPIIPGFPTVDLYMNRPLDVDGRAISDQDFPVQPFMQGVLLNRSTYVILADFCKELSIDFAYRATDKSIHLGVKTAPVR